MSFVDPPGERYFERGATDLSQTLDAVTTFIRRFVVLSDEQDVALALWTLHTHAISATDTTPYIGITSAEKRSGKTLLLEVLGLLVREPLPTANISDAALFRAIAKLEPCLLFDEVDAIFGPKARDREDLRGLLNAGYRRGAVAWRMGGSNNTTLESFPVYCAKAFAGIGELPDTIADRSIRIRLERRTRDEPIDRFRRRDAGADAEPIFQSLESLAGHHADRLTYAQPELPDELDDRAQDCWEPLLAIADLAGGDWPHRARAAAVALSTGNGREDESLGAQLLKDIHSVFHASETRRYKTVDLIAELSTIEESPWGDWLYGKPISAQGLSKLLKSYQIKTMPVKVKGTTVRGYKAEQFADAWLRVLGVTGVTSVTCGTRSQEGGNAGNAGNASHAGEAERHVPSLGDQGFEKALEAAFDAGHLTAEEASERLWLHELVAKARAA